MALVDSLPSWKRGFTSHPTDTLRPDAAEDADVADTAPSKSTRRPISVDVDGRGVVLGTEVIGRGGMGQVLAGTQSRVAREVAVKKLHPDHKHDAHARVALLQEAWLTGALEHPGIVPVYDIDVAAPGDSPDSPGGIGGEEPLVIMKRIDGASWHELLRDANAVKLLGAADVLEWHLGVLSRVCDAVELAHSRGIIHRDIKPHNVMVGSFGEVYLLDWGLAVSLRDDGSGRFPLAKEVYKPAGTPGYMAPEQLDENGERLGPATDVYLLGACLYEIVTGRPPHRGNEPLEMIESILHGPPPLGADVPRGLARLINECTAAEPSARIQRPSEVKRAIATFLATRGSERLTQAATQATEELERVAQLPVDKETLQKSVRAFAEARIGFRLAKETWPDNPDVAGGIARATTAAVDVMLKSGSIDTAAAILASVSTPPPGVRERVERAIDEARAEKEKLKAVARDYDIHRGRRFRGLLAGALGAAALVSSVLNHVGVVVKGNERSQLTAVLVAVAFVVFVLGVRVVFRRDIDTLLNRKFLSVAAAACAGGLLLRLALWALLPDDHVLGDQLIFAMWAVGTLCAAVGLEPRVWPAALGYAVFMAIAIMWPDLRFLAQGAGHLMLTANAYWVLARKQMA
jgi:serine/threonine protein kinase